MMVANTKYTIKLFKLGARPLMATWYYDRGHLLALPSYVQQMARCYRPTHKQWRNHGQVCDSDSN